MSKGKTFGQAFQGAAGDYNGSKFGNRGQAGMTMRDYFAAKAMQSLLAEDVSKQPHECMGQEWVARLSYSIADTMIAERDKQKQEGV